MDMRRATTALVCMGCSCFVAAGADAQQRRSGNRPPVQFDLRQMAQPRAEPERLDFEREPPSAGRRDGLVESWDMPGNIVMGVGRYAIPRIQRTLNHTERMGTGMERRGSAIAGAGMSLSF